MVVIDEASQLLFANAYPPLKYLKPNTGRLVLAGDDEQLDPIKGGKQNKRIASTFRTFNLAIVNCQLGLYPLANRDEPYLYSSIVQAIKHLDVHFKCTKMLNENWRMNKGLSALPAKTIYKTVKESEVYHPANAEAHVLLYHYFQLFFRPFETLICEDVK
jgi:superfamily I DNA and/or RNA helicase